MASNKVAEYARKMREKKMAEVGRGRGVLERPCGHRNICLTWHCFITLLLLITVAI